MPSRDTARAALRSATAESHDRVDRLFSGLSLGDRDDYGRFLTAQAQAHLAVEAALDRAGAGAILPDWRERQRASALRADLAALGLAEPPPAAAPAFADAAAVLGGVYVLEGARLGGRLLARSVPPAFPRSFLGAGDPAAWRTLLAVVEERLAEAQTRASAIGAARAVFALFEESGRRVLADQPARSSRTA